MNMFIKSTAIALLASTTIAHAGGLDRSGQKIGILFEEGTYGELSFGYVMPKIDVTGPVPAQNSPNVAQSYFAAALGYKADYSNSVSWALIIDQPYGANVDYVGGALDGAFADVSSVAITGLAKYKFTDNISVYGGLRAQNVGAVVVPLPAPRTYLANTWGFGYVIGAAYEVPSIALRAALTYHSEVTHNMATTGGLGAGTTTIVTPQAISLDFQTGIMADTLLMASVRWAEWSRTTITPPNFPGSIVDMTDSTTYSIGIGRRFSEQLSAALSIGYEAPKGDPVSPLSPTDGYISVTLGGSYKTGPYKFTAGVSYVVPGNATLTAGPFTTANNSAIGVGFKIGRSF